MDFLPVLYNVAHLESKTSKRIVLVCTIERKSLTIVGVESPEIYNLLVIAVTNCYILAIFDYKSDCFACWYDTHFIDLGDSKLTDAQNNINSVIWNRTCKYNE